MQVVLQTKVGYKHRTRLDTYFQPKIVISPHLRGGEHTVCGADPVGVGIGIGIGVSVTVSCLQDSL